MGIFNSIFGNSKEEISMDFWNPISSDEDLQVAINQSFDKEIAIFKHSTRCGISARVKSKFEKEIKEKQPDVLFYYLDLLANRDLSNKIADTFGVTHQSPQLIVIKNGVLVSHASHGEISTDIL